MKGEGKKIKFLGVTIYERRVEEDSESQIFLGIPLRRKVVDSQGKKCYLLGIRYRNIPTKYRFRVGPPQLTLEKYVELKNSSPKELLITPCVGIGDYILWRNFITEIKNTPKYRDYRIVMICDERSRKFSEWLDQGVVDQFIPCGEAVDTKPNLVQLERVRNHLFKNGMKRYYDTIVLVSFMFNAKDQRKITNHLISGVTSRERIGFCQSREKADSAEFMHLTQVYVARYNCSRVFIFNVFKSFFEWMLEREISLPHPVIDTTVIKNIQTAYDQYMVVSPCASAEFKTKRWHKNNWVELLSRLWKQYELPIIIICASNEQEMAIDIQAELRSEGISVDMCSGLSVEDLMAVLKDARLYIGLDSGIFHIATAMGLKTCCISSGRTYSRWLEGYSHRHDVRVVIPKGWREWYAEMTKNPEWSYPEKSHVINAVRVTDVVAAVKELL